MPLVSPKGHRRACGQIPAAARFTPLRRAESRGSAGFSASRGLGGFLFRRRFFAARDGEKQRAPPTCVKLFRSAPIRSITLLVSGAGPALGAGKRFSFASIKARNAS